MQPFDPLPALAGGALIGLSASLFLLTHGRIAGISGLFGGLLEPKAPDRPIRLVFIAGLLAAGLLFAWLLPGALPDVAPAPLGGMAAAGLLVGYGTRLGSGCTSGHGVCGLSRLSARSLAATLTFMATAGVTVFVFRHLLGGGP